jgi:hypothetical protein
MDTLGTLDTLDTLDTHDTLAGDTPRIPSAIAIKNIIVLCLCL